MEHKPTKRDRNRNGRQSFVYNSTRINLVIEDFASEVFITYFCSVVAGGILKCYAKFEQWRIWDVVERRRREVCRSAKGAEWGGVCYVMSMVLGFKKGF